MKFNHRVKFNGVYYEAGQNVPIEEIKAENKENTKPQSTLETRAEEVEKGRNAQKLITSDGYTKTEINRMSTAELKKLSKEQGIDNAEEMTGADLKKVLIEKFGL